MKRHSYWLVVLGIWVSMVGAGKPADPSSEIPARREYPINDKINPCDNFYEYACSEVKTHFKLRDDRSKHTFSFGDSAERILDAKKKFMRELPKKKNLSKRAKNLKDFYGACMNVPASKAEEQATVKRILAEVNAIKTREEFQDYVAKNMNRAETAFLNFDTIANQDNPDWLDALFMSNLKYLPERSYYDKKDVMTDFAAYVRDFFKTIKVDKAKERTEWVVDFQTQFAKTYPLPSEMRDLFSVKTQISKEALINEFPALRLQEFLKQVPDKTVIRNITPDNFKFLNKQLVEAPLDALKSNFLFSSLRQYMDDAYPAFYQKGFEFNRKHLGGPDKRPVREERCTRLVMSYFEKEIDAEVLPIMFPNFPEDKVTVLAENVRSSILRGLESNDWLSEEGKKGAIEKIKAAHLQLVKPKNDEEWDFTPDADYSPKTPYANRRTLQIVSQAKDIRELKEVRNRNRWFSGPLTVNAYYSNSDNRFVLLQGILQYPFFDGQLSPEQNLGGIGVVIGHELGHGVDDKGARYDSAGVLRQWMPDKDLAEFKRRGEKMVALFDKAGHNGKLTLGENIGDHTGLTFAYAAAFPNNQGTQEAKRAFFLQYGRVWCEVMRPKYQEKMMKTDPHSMGYARVNEQLKLQPAFQEAYSCKEGDKMVLPESERFRIW